MMAFSASALIFDPKATISSVRNALTCLEVSAAA